MSHKITFRPALCLILFLLTLATPLISQDIGAILAVQEIDTMLYSGAKDNRINWVIQNRGDSFNDKEDFTTLYENNLLKAFEQGHELAQVPYAQYRNFFNLYTFWWPDAPDDNTGWTFGTIQALRDAVFLPWANDRTGWVSFFSSTKYGGGGGAGLNREARVGDGKMYGMGWETFLHEFGHTMPGLLDEYSASGEWSNSQCWETPNTTGQLNVEDIPWRLWIEPGTPIPTPYTAVYLDKFGAFEGAMTNYFGCHRPTARGCFMGAGGFGEDYGLELCSPCIQRVICYLYKYVDVIENPQPATGDLIVNGTETLTFSVNVVKPEPNTQAYEWRLNGKVIATDTETVEVTFDACDSYELVFSVRDNNPLVRFDPKFADTYPEPYQELKWTINQAAVSTYTLASTPYVQGADCSGTANGWVDFSISGGEAPYEIYLDGEAQANPVTNLPAGDYTFFVVDANGCGIKEEVSIMSEPLLNPEICSSYADGNWTLTLEDEIYPSAALNYLWSTGATTPTIEGLPDGEYSVTVAVGSGCSKIQSISLMTTADPIAVTEMVFPSGLDVASGSIYLDITGGQPPYTIDWYDQPNTDLTSPSPSSILVSGTTWGHEPAFAFDDDLNTKWLHAMATNTYIGYQLAAPTPVSYYVITSADDVPERDPKNWQFQGSNDGTNWTILDQQINQNFTSRFQRRSFVFSNNVAYQYYRLFVQENHGDIATQLQELEIVGTDATADFVRNHLVQGQATRKDLVAGAYRYVVKDDNQTASVNTLLVGYTAPFTALDLVVVQDGDCQVRIATPSADHTYYWFADAKATQLLNIGTTFQPLLSGNYYVAAVNNSTGALSENIQGFAVIVQTTPDVEALSDTELGIVDPDPALIYHWYDQESCGTPIHTGTVFAPQEAGFYYVAAQRPPNAIVPQDPGTIPGLIIRMDAADLNGDETIDNPQLPTSSLYGWSFSNGNSWADDNWYAYRSNYQNGLGVADFATIWLQRIAQSETGYQTILMAYEENPITFPNRAPFEGLSVNIPSHSDPTQLYSNSAPARTLNGTTYLNGAIVDPLITANPLEFCILGTVMTERSFDEVYYTDTQWEGKIGELILYDRALTEVEMQAASAYLRTKWISTADLESPRRTLNWDGMALDNETLTATTPLFIHPNPTSGRFTVSGLQAQADIQIVSQAGLIVQNIQCLPGQNHLDMQHLSAGLYFVKIKEEGTGKVAVVRMVKL
ncbi:M64 family metallopeptidase [Lewinella sp. LCG006]|uniref:discoidin domain-containing protein n=1 Tax=Lewinella sp. LCG006 TaxID=3231911 RepID=UPI00345F1C7A